MPRISTVDLVEARSCLRGRSAGYAARAPYREAIAQLQDDRMLELELDEGENMRQLRLNVARADREVNCLVESGVSREGTLLIWLAEKPRRTRAPRKRRDEAGEG